MVSKFNPPLTDIFPFVQHFYTMGNTFLDYAESEKDLGVVMTRTLNFTEHATSISNKATRDLGS